MVNISLTVCMLCIMICPLAAQNASPYNKELYFLHTAANVEVRHIDSLKILLVNFEKYEKEAFKISLKNNPSAFPIKNMPNLNQFDYSCSFNEIPASWCRCENLRRISFSNYKVVPVDRCFRKKIKNANYSNLSIFDGIEGPEVVKILSKDRRKSDR